MIHGKQKKENGHKWVNLAIKSTDCARLLIGLDLYKGYYAMELTEVEEKEIERLMKKLKTNLSWLIKKETEHDSNPAPSSEQIDDARRKEIMTTDLNTWGIPLTTGFTAWFVPQGDITAYELSLLSILTATKRTLEDTQKTFDIILQTAPLIIRHFNIRMTNA